MAIKTVIISLSIAVSLSACSAKFDPRSVQAKAGAPVPAQVEEISIARNESLPTYVMTVEPFRFQQGVTSFLVETNIVQGTLKVDSTVVPAESVRFSRMLQSSLSGVKNFSLIENDFADKAKLSRGEQGLYIIRALVTEYSTLIESSENNTQVLFYASEEGITTGVVGLDISIVEKATGRVISNFPVHGTFGSRMSSVNNGGILPVYRERYFARSTADQALRVASNEASKRIFEELKKK